MMSRDLASYALAKFYVELTDEMEKLTFMPDLVSKFQKLVNHVYLKQVSDLQKEQQSEILSPLEVIEMENKDA